MSKGHHLGIGVGFLVELLLETSLFLVEQVQAIVADLGQSDPLDGLAAGGKGVVGLLSLTCDAGPVLLHERLVDGLSMFLCGFLQLCVGGFGDRSSARA